MLACAPRWPRASRNLRRFQNHPKSDDSTAPIDGRTRVGFCSDHTIRARRLSRGTCPGFSDAYCANAAAITSHADRTVYMKASVIPLTMTTDGDCRIRDGVSQAKISLE